MTSQKRIVVRGNARRLLKLYRPVYFNLCAVRFVDLFIVITVNY